jgi:DNA repair exonuclease SbcCD ATPase subunit
MVGERRRQSGFRIAHDSRPLILPGSSTVPEVPDPNLPEKSQTSPLHERLQAQVESERSRQELIEELWEQRRTAEHEDAARRIEVLERAREEARAHAAERERLERALADAEAKAKAEAAARAGLEQDLAKVRADARAHADDRKRLEQALAEAKAKAAERERLEQDLAKARAEARTHATEREKLQHALAAGRATEAERDEVRVKLDKVRVEAAKLAIEVGESERDAEEARKARAELERSLARERAERKREQERLQAIEQLLEAATGGEGAPAEAEATTQSRGGAAPRAEEPQKPPVPEQPVESHGRLGIRKRVFQSRGRTCAVCKTTEANSPGALKAAGWALGPENDLCPACQEHGWQLPKGGSLPFRRSSHRDRADA